MKSSKASEYIFLIAVAFVTTLSQYCTPVNKANNTEMQKVNNELLTGFITPPDSTKPFVYWYWRPWPALALARRLLVTLV